MYCTWAKQRRYSVLVFSPNLFELLKPELFPTFTTWLNDTPAPAFNLRHIATYSNVEYSLWTLVPHDWHQLTCLALPAAVYTKPLLFSTEKQIITAPVMYFSVLSNKLCWIPPHIGVIRGTGKKFLGTYVHAYFLQVVSKRAAWCVNLSVGKIKRPSPSKPRSPDCSVSVILFVVLDP